MSSTGFDEFFHSDYPLLVGFLQKIGFEQEAAKDAVAEAMLSACRSWSRIDSPRSWVRQAAFRIASSQARRATEAPRRAIAAGWVASSHLDPDVVELREEHELLLQLLAELPDQQRLVIACDLEEFTDDEIAKYAKIDRSTVRSHRRHARDKLKKLYQEISAGRNAEAAARGRE